ncbi:MAG TPA: hypothetical protein VFF73_37695 [Planctomycetota bacterium]|nr:hypothetical protein [Planctomycetota bacterium]
MALHLGFDPGGTGKKLAHVTAALDGDERLFVGRLRDRALLLPVFQRATFPYLDGASVAAIEGALSAMLASLLAEIGPDVPAGADPREVALDRYGAVIVSVDASSGFAVPGSGRRHTEGCVGANFNTPDESRFLASAVEWHRLENVTPLNQRVYWKLVGFTIYRWFTRARSAAQVAAAAARRIGPGFTVTLERPTGVTIFESFPSETYRGTRREALAVARSFAGRRLAPIPDAPLHASTLATFAERLRLVARRKDAWARSRGKAVGDCLDAFSSMMLGPWSTTIGLAARGDSPALMAAEGAIVVPR